MLKKPTLQILAREAYKIADLLAKNEQLEKELAKISQFSRL